MGDNEPKAAEKSPFGAVSGLNALATLVFRHPQGL